MFFLPIIRVAFEPTKSTRSYQDNFMWVNFKRKLNKKSSQKVSKLIHWVGFNNNIK